ncbi:protein of unknown function [Cyanobium sp. NIES-981]|nr:protein of unknown function [Cyanobium sp. NIES-981]
MESGMLRRNWPLCRVHHRYAEGFAYARNLLQWVSKAHQGMVTAALRSVFAQEKAAEIEARWDDLASSLAERFPRAADLMLEAREDVLAFRHFPDQHWRKVWSTNLLERVNEEIKCRTRLVGAVLLEQGEHWQLEGRQVKQNAPDHWYRQQPIACPDERLDKSIVRVHRETTRRPRTTRMTARHSLLFTIESG